MTFLNSKTMDKDKNLIPTGDYCYAKMPVELQYCVRIGKSVEKML